MAAVLALFAFGAITSSAQAINKNPIAVYPAAGTPVASDSTSFSFRGVKAKNMGPIKVIGSRSGRHGGTRKVHSDGKGVSWIPKKNFQSGENVRVVTKRKLVRAKNGTFKVRIGRFYGKDDKSGKPDEVEVNDGLKSRPDLKPPKLDMVVPGVNAAPGKIFVAPKEEGRVIADNFGRISWFRPIDFEGAGETVENFQAQEWKGRPVLTNYLGSTTARGYSQRGVYEIFNKKYNRIKQFKPGNGYAADTHDFEITPWDTALVLSYRGVKWNTSSAGGGKNGKLMDNVFQEIDLKTGAVLFEWHSIGNVPMNEDNPDTPPEQEENGNWPVWDYFHINAVKPDGKNAFLISGRRNSGIYRIDRKTARNKWYLNGAGNGGDFKVAADATFGYQHDMNRLPNGDISIFDNGIAGGLPTVNEVGSGLVIRLSGKGKNRRADLVQRNLEPTGKGVGSQGSARVLPDGGMFVGWGSTKRATEYDVNGNIVLDMTFDDSPGNSYRAFKSTWNGVPKRRPAIASEATEGGGANVYASWNGSQETTDWKVLTGPNASDLSVAASSSWQNLETMIPVPAIGAVVQVQSIDKDGKVLGESAVTSIGQQSR